jgi:nucleoside-diphosphate-sugar epimerase
MKICVTGATGFVGSALCKALAVSGHDLVKVVRKGKEAGMVAVGDIGAATVWVEAVAGCDVVVHLAARVHVMHETAADPAALFDAVNTVGTRKLVQAAAAAGVKRFVFVSTVKVNGERTASGHPFTETDAPAPQDAYARSKYQAEEDLKQLAAQKGMEWVIIRPPLVYGPGVKANFAALAKATGKGWPLPLGSIRNQRSMVALDNLVDFISCCTYHPQAANQIFLISDGHDLSTPELVRQLALAAEATARLPCIPVALLKTAAALLGKKGVVERMSESLQVDISKARTLLKWVPPVTVEQGLAQVMLGWPSS